MDPSVKANTGRGTNFLFLQQHPFHHFLGVLSQQEQHNLFPPRHSWNSKVSPRSLCTLLFVQQEASSGPVSPSHRSNIQYPRIFHIHLPSSRFHTTTTQLQSTGTCPKYEGVEKTQQPGKKWHLKEETEKMVCSYLWPPQLFLGYNFNFIFSPVHRHPSTCLCHCFLPPSGKGFLFLVAAVPYLYPTKHLWYPKWCTYVAIATRVALLYFNDMMQSSSWPTTYHYDSFRLWEVIGCV